jgi:hypothetical protein
VPVTSSASACGHFDAFKLGPLPGGWDAAAWAAAGFPASGTLTFNITVNYASDMYLTAGVAGFFCPKSNGVEHWSFDIGLVR